MRQRSGSKASSVDINKVNIFNPPLPTADTHTTLLFLPSGTPICRTDTAMERPQNPTQPTQSGLLKGVNPVRPVNLTGANPATSTRQSRLWQLTHYLSPIRIQILCKILQLRLHLLLHHLQVIQLQTTLQVVDLRH